MGDGTFLTQGHTCRPPDVSTGDEMCPVCEGRGWVDCTSPEHNDQCREPCFACETRGMCDPIPVRGHQGLLPLTPEQLR